MTGNLRRIINKHFDLKQDRFVIVPGQLGDGLGNLYPGQENYVWVRAGGGLEIVFNNRVAPENDLMVMVGRDAVQPDLYQVLSTRSAFPGGTIGGAVGGIAPAKRYQWQAEGGGQDPLWVEKRQYLPGRIGAWVGMFIQIYPDIYWTGTLMVLVQHQTADLTGYLPTTAGKAAAVLVTVNATGAVIKTVGSEVDFADLVLADIPAIPVGTVAILGAVRVYEGQTELREMRTNSDFIDLRGSGWIVAADDVGFSNPMNAAGDIIVGGASGVAEKLVKGTALQVLRMNSGASTAEWADPAAAGVPTSRTIATTAPLTGGGDLSANRTLAIADGYFERTRLTTLGDMLRFNIQPSTNTSTLTGTVPICCLHKVWGGADPPAYTFPMIATSAGFVSAAIVVSFSIRLSRYTSGATNGLNYNWCIKRDNASGAVIASSGFGVSGNSTNGNIFTITGSYNDTSPTTGIYILQIYETWDGTYPAGGTVYEIWTSAGTLTTDYNVPATARLPIGTTGQVLTVAAGLPSWQAAAVGTVTSVTGTAPIVSSGGATPAISINAATTSLPGSMSSADKTKSDGIATGAQVNVLEGVTGTTPIVAGAITAKSQAISIPAATASAPGHATAAQITKLDGIAAGANAYTHPNHSGDVTSVGDGAQTIANDAVTNAKSANMAVNTVKGRITAGTGDPEDLTEAQVRTITNTADKATIFRNEAFVRFISPMLEALTWAAAQIYQAAVTFQSTISQTVTSAGAGTTFNQSGTGDIAAYQDAGVVTMRVPDQGGVVLVPQAGGYQNIVGLVAYDSVKKRLVLYHESHNYPVPIDPRNVCRNEQFRITY